MSETEVLRPTGAGSSTQLSPTAGSNWQCVDDESDEEYCETSSSTAKRDLYTITNTSFPANSTIEKVVITCAFGCWTGDGLGRVAIKSGATLAYGSWEFAHLNTDVIEYATDPNTGAAWTKEAVDALEIGGECKTSVPSYPAAINWIKATVHFVRGPVAARGAQWVGPRR